jgi:hypothetical protein
MKKRLQFLWLLCLLFSTQLIGQNLPSYLPSGNLLAWYPFSGNANDESGNNNHGVNYGASLTVDRHTTPNRAFSFDGNSYVLTPIKSSSPSGISLGIWFKTNVWRPYAGLLCSRTGPNLLNGLELVNEMGKKSLILDLRTPTDFHRVEYVDSTLANNQWHSIVGVYDGTTMKLYVDGSLKSQLTTSFTLTVQDPFKIGVDDIFNLERSFVGDLDDVFLYSKPLSETEIQKIYQGGLSGHANIEVDTKPALFPNPAIGTITIKSEHLSDNCTYKIFDLNGTLVQTGFISSDQNQIDVSGLEKGSYSFQLENSYHLAKTIFLVL